MPIDADEYVNVNNMRLLINVMNMKMSTDMMTIVNAANDSECNGLFSCNK